MKCVIICVLIICNIINININNNININDNDNK